MYYELTKNLEHVKRVKEHVKHFLKKVVNYV